MPKTKKLPYDWSRPPTDTEVKFRYTIGVKKKRFQALLSNEDKNSANTIYNNITQVHREATELHVPHKAKNMKSLWEGKKVVQKRDALQDVLKGISDAQQRRLTRCSQRHQ